MYSATILRTKTDEAIRMEHIDLRSALAMLNAAWFACGYDETAITATITNEDTGLVLRAWWEEDDEE